MAPAAGSKSDSILAVVSMYWKLTPEMFEACLIAPATRARDGSRTAVCEALELSTDMMEYPPRAALSGAGNSDALSSHRGTGMVNAGLIRVGPSPSHSGARIARARNPSSRP